MRNLSIMLKPASSLCNMRCKYCFYHSLASNRDSYSYGIMTEDTITSVISQALDLASGGSIYFAFQGGEPLIAGIEYFRSFVAITSQLNTRNSTIHYSLQTNGTLIDEDWANFFKDNSFLIGLSLDGDRNDNKFRVASDYSPVFGKVMDTSILLSRYNIPYNILVVTTGYTANHIDEIYHWLTGQGFKHLQFIPCLRPFGDTSENELYMTVPEYQRFLIHLFNLYVKDYTRGNYTSIRYFDNLVRLYLGQTTEQCGLCGHCSHQFVVESNGNVYPCDFYCCDEWLLGNINNNSLANLSHSSLAVQFISNSLSVPNKCKQCKYYTLCRSGGCKRTREDRDYCRAYYAFFESSLPLFRVFAHELPTV